MFVQADVRGEEKRETKDALVWRCYRDSGERASRMRTGFERIKWAISGWPAEYLTLSSLARVSVNAGLAVAYARDIRGPVMDSCLAASRRRGVHGMTSQGPRVVGAGARVAEGAP